MPPGDVDFAIFGVDPYDLPNPAGLFLVLWGLKSIVRGVCQKFANYNRVAGVSLCFASLTGVVLV